MKTMGSRQAVLEGLRARIAGIGRGALPRPAARSLPLGAPEIDQLLPGGGLPLASIHEVAGDGSGAALGFILALLRRLGAGRPLPVLWCLPDLELYGPGLAAFGFDPARLLLARLRGKGELLWAMEEGLRAPSLAAVVAETGSLTVKAQRRLQLAAEAGGVTGFLLRETSGGPANFSVTSWRLAAAQSGGNGTVRWRVELARCRGGNMGSWLMEWNRETGDFSVVAPAPGRAD